MIERHIRRDKNGARILWLNNGTVKMGIPLDFGIRISHLSLSGCRNLFYEQPADLSDGFAEKSGWVLRGGHRFWGSPESNMSYFPDNQPVAAEELADGVLLKQDTDPWTGLEKKIEVHFTGENEVTLVHHLINRGADPARFASWGISTLKKSGKALLNFTGYPTDEYVPNRKLTCWSTTNPADPRIRVKETQIEAYPDRPADNYFKIGLLTRDCHARYVLGQQQLDITNLIDDDEGSYPDGGVNLEMYLCNSMLELEFLGHEALLTPGEEASHTEIWQLKRR